MKTRWLNLQQTHMRLWEELGRFKMYKSLPRMVIYLIENLILWLKSKTTKECDEHVITVHKYITSSVSVDQRGPFKLCLYNFAFQSYFNLKHPVTPKIQKTHPSICIRLVGFVNFVFYQFLISVVHLLSPHCKMKKASKSNYGTSQECRCQRSACLKNYCRCYNADRMCGASCKCIGEFDNEIYNPRWRDDKTKSLLRLQERPSWLSPRSHAHQNRSGYATKEL